MGVRFSLGGGFSAGRSGLRYNTRNFGVGRSGVRLNAGPVRVWVPGKRTSKRAYTVVPQAGDSNWMIALRTAGFLFLFVLKVAVLLYLGVLMCMFALIGGAGSARR